MSVPSAYWKLGVGVFLKSIELFGFKSFADKSLIEFTDGISALLGPNGCGKSNVVDAVKWVLGEQSTRTLRADKMEDVIFNGTESRKALSVAEVALILSNDEGGLPIDRAEISVKRRLYRSGESEYYLNNTPTKLKDLRELFYDTGVGKSAYSIMEQGRIDQILSNKPEDRRYIFEEAAGITKYKVRGAEAERRLQRTEDNMRQVENILREVKRSYDSLKVQAQKTQSYRDFRERIFGHELNINLLRLRDSLETEERKKEELDRTTMQRSHLRSRIDEINRALESNLDLVNAMESNLVNKQKSLYRSELERNNCDNQIQLQKERIEEISKQIAVAKDRIASVQSMIDSLNAQVEERANSLRDLVVRIGEIEQNITSFEHNVEIAQQRMKGNREKIATHESDAARLTTYVTTLQAELRELYDDIVTQLDAKLAETGYSYQIRTRAEEALFQALESFRIHLEGRLKLIQDTQRVEAEVTSEKTSAAFIEFLNDGSSRLQEIRKLAGNFRDSIPVFIDDFVAPEGIITRKRDIDRSVEESLETIGELTNLANTLRTENQHLGERIEEYRATLEDLRVTRARMLTQKASIEESTAMLLSRRSDHEKQLIDDRREIATLKDRMNGIREHIRNLQQNKSEFEKEVKQLQSELDKLERGIATRNKNLVKEEKQLKRLMSDLDKIQSAVERTQIDLASVHTEIRTIYDNFGDRHSRDLKQYQDRMYEIGTPLTDIRAQLTDVREQLRLLGQVNLMAPEEFEEVRERFDFLTEQISDLRKARTDLVTVTEQIRAESTELFLETYNQIKKNFHMMFRRLFGGGRAELTLTEANEVLTSGVEILAQPPGKKLESIDLLSGGEKSLTAVALLFATYMVRPSPFCILDEIDAALDEENVGRFINLLKEFASSSQFIIITHNKRTVSSADTLLGITMEESGISKVISIRIGAREEVSV